MGTTAGDGTFRRQVVGTAARHGVCASCPRPVHLKLVKKETRMILYHGHTIVYFLKITGTRANSKGSQSSQFKRFYFTFTTVCNF